MTADDVTKEMPLSKATLAKWRCHGTGPGFVELGARVMYRRADLNAWMEANTRKPAAATNVIEGIGFAAVIALPLNRFVTIHWQAGGAAPGPAATGQFLKSASDWLRLRGVALAYAWVRETGDFKGEHVHIAMHVSPALGIAFGHRQRGWVRAAGARCWRGHPYPPDRQHRVARAGRG